MLFFWNRTSLHIITVTAQLYHHLQMALTDFLFCWIAMARAEHLVPNDKSKSIVCKCNLFDRNWNHHEFGENYIQSKLCVPLCTVLNYEWNIHSKPEGFNFDWSEFGGVSDMQSIRIFTLCLTRWVIALLSLVNTCTAQTYTKRPTWISHKMKDATTAAAAASAEQTAQTFVQQSSIMLIKSK